MRYRKIYLLSLGLLLLVQIPMSCSKPEFAKEPQISFKSIEVLEGELENERDTLLITISFTDGDGDLGYSQQEIQADLTRDLRDVELEYYERQEDERKFKKVITNIQDESDYSSSYILPELNERKGKTTIKGELEIKKAVWYKINESFKEVKCKVRIRDRANNLSNQVETDAVIILKD